MACFLKLKDNCSLLQILDKIIAGKKELPHMSLYIFTIALLMQPICHARDSQEDQ